MFVCKLGALKVNTHLPLGTKRDSTHPIVLDELINRIQGSHRETKSHL
jgi:hypothetical protein